MNSNGGSEMSSARMIDHATDALAAGLCVVPPRGKGSKAPLGSWRDFQSKRPDDGQLHQWYGNGDLTGIGAVLGKISGNVELLEFDERSVYERYVDLCRAAGLGELVDRVELGYHEESPNGVHWLYRCEVVEGNTKLARRPKTAAEREHPNDNVKVLIETRGEGGYVVLAPTHGDVHPSGRPYRFVSGSYGSIETITADERASLFSLARSMDAMPRSQPAASQPLAAQRPPDSTERPGDYFNRTHSWSDVLVPHGWTQAFTHQQETHWVRPGKHERSGTSATTNYAGTDLLKVFSTSTGFDTERTYDRFGAFAVLEHGGKFTDAARAVGATMPSEARGRQVVQSSIRTVDQETGEIVEQDAAGSQSDEPDRHPVPSPEAGRVLDPPLREFKRIHMDLAEPFEPLTLLDEFGVYEGRLTKVYGEPEAGKSWFALWLSIRAMKSGLPVIYLDEEGGQNMIKERLIALGAERSMILDLFWYFEFEQRSWNPSDLEALSQMLDEVAEHRPGGIAIFDSLPDFLTAAGKNENDPADVTAFVNETCSRFRDRNVAQVILDHVPKPDVSDPDTKRRTHNRYGRGTGAKLSKADASVQLLVKEYFDRSSSGMLQLFKGKDRPGQITRLTRATDTTKPATLIEVRVNSKVGTVKMVPRVAERSPIEHAQHVVQSIQAAIRVCLTTPTIRELSQNQIFKELQGNKNKLVDALKDMVVSGELRTRSGPRGATLYSLASAAIETAEQGNLVR